MPARNGVLYVFLSVALVVHASEAVEFPEGLGLEAPQVEAGSAAPPPISAPIEHLRWNGTPIPLALPVGVDRVVRFPADVRVGAAGEAYGKLTSDLGRWAVYFRALEPFEPTLVLVQETEGALSGGLRSVQAKPPSLRGVGLTANPEALVWIEPVGLPAALAGPNAAKPGDAKPAPEKQTPPLKPVYTIAENMALAGSTAFTALVGRIPILGHIQDPFPFYVLVGPDNLAANGLELPEVAGVIFLARHSGTGISPVCAGGSSPRPSSSTMGPSALVRGTEQEPLGELADAFGVPCVSGKRITDAASYLSQRVLVSAVGAAGDAAAAAQSTNTTSGLTGVGTSTVTGDVGKFILGRTVRESAQDIEDWLDARFADSFDAVFAAPGSTVSLLIQREMTIDYDPVGRKLRHANASDLYRRNQLD